MILLEIIVAEHREDEIARYFIQVVRGYSDFMTRCRSVWLVVVTADS